MGKVLLMLKKSQGIVLAAVLLGVSLLPAQAAEREEVRKVINLVTSVKMPFPEKLSRDRAVGVRRRARGAAPAQGVAGRA